MKLYIKANNLTILKNYQELIVPHLSKAKPFLEESLPIYYKTSILSAKEIEKHKKIFVEDKEIKKLIKGVYFGNSYCEHLLPNVWDILRAKALFDDRYHNFVFVFPPISQNKSDLAKQILFELKDMTKEIVVNDFGMLKRVQDMGFRAILGLNFTKTIKSAFLQNANPTDLTKNQLNNQQELLRGLEFEIRALREYYKSLGVGRFGIENLEVDLNFLDELPKMNIDLYYPFITISNSRACDIAGVFDDKKGYFAFEECSKWCNQLSLEFEHSEIFGLYQRYNSVLKINTALNISKSVYKNKKNRLVWEIFL